MDIEVSTPITAEAEVKRYLLVGDDIYMMRYDSATIPDWYRTLLENALNGSGVINSIEDLITNLSLLANGHSIAINSINNVNDITNTRLEALTASRDASTAAIAELDITKITATDAMAMAHDVVAAYFGTQAGAWFDNKISTYASNIEANASNVSVLAATLNNQTVRIDSVEEVAIGAAGWSANASKFITAPDGTVTGWSFADGSNASSTFKIVSDTLEVISSDTLERISLEPIKFIGDFATAPLETSTSINSVYRNTVNNNMYILKASGWELYIPAGITQGKFYGIGFLRSATQPATPTGGSYDNPTPDGWGDGIPAEDGNPCWWTSRRFTSDGLSPQDATWSEPTILSNTKTFEYEYSVDNINWTTSATNAVYARVRENINGVWGGWVSYRIKGETGAAGTNGANGMRGSLTVSYNGTYSSPSATTSIFQTATGYYDAVIGDEVTFVSTSGTKRYFRTSSSVNSWSEIAMYVHGNMLVSGTVSASAIAAGSITVDKLQSGQSSLDAWTVFGFNSVYNGKQAAVFGAKVDSGYGVYGIGATSGVLGQGGLFGGFFIGTGTVGIAGPDAIYIPNYNGSSIYIGSDTYAGRFAKGAKLIELCNASYAAYWSGGATGSFTGGHDAFIANDELPEQGDILTVVRTAGKEHFYDTSPIVTLCTTAKNKGVYGAMGEYIGEEHLYASLADENGAIPLEYAELLRMHKGVVCVALGEAQINVCGLGGNIEAGDYICSSAIAGKGMKQDDDLLHNYTVAKSLESVTFDTPEQVKMIACTYHCG